MVILTFSATMSELGDQIILRHMNQNSTISNPAGLLTLNNTRTSNKYVGPDNVIS